MRVSRSRNSASSTSTRSAFERPRAGLGEQPDRVGGVRTWVVPNPSGLNAHFQLPDLARLYGELRAAAGRSAAEDPGGG